MYYQGDIQPITALKTYTWNGQTAETPLYMEFGAEQWADNKQRLEELIMAQVKYCVKHQVLCKGILQGSLHIKHRPHGEMLQRAVLLKATSLAHDGCSFDLEQVSHVSLIRKLKSFVAGAAEVWPTPTHHHHSPPPFSHDLRALSVIYVFFKTMKFQMYRPISRADYYDYLEAKTVCEKMKDKFRSQHCTYQDIMQLLFSDSEVNTCVTF